MMVRLFALGVIASLGISTTVIAQPRKERVEGDRREQVKKKIRALRAYTLTEELGLDEPTAGKLFPMLARYDDELDKLVVSRGEVQKRLADASTLKDAAAIDKVVDEALANQRAFRSFEDRRLADFRRILTAAQVAKIMLVLPALERKIQGQLRQVIQDRARVVDPFDQRGDAPEPKPVARDGTAKPPTAPVPARPNEPCDPFDTRAGCGGIGKDKAWKTPHPPKDTNQTTGYLDVTSRPMAHVVIDGADTGLTTPLAGKQLTVGKHKVTLRIGEDRFTWPITIEAGETFVLTKVLE